MFVTRRPLTHLTQQSPYLLVGKLAVVVALALWGAQALTASNRADYRRGEALTREAYAADYEQYRAKLMKDSDSFPLNAVFLVVFLVGAFSLYEIAGHGLGCLVQAAVEPRAPEDRRLPGQPADENAGRTA